MNNPLLEHWDTPLGLPPFGNIEVADFQPALEFAMQEHRREIDAIANQADPATFANTTLAVDRAGRLLSRVSAVFSNLGGAHTNDELQAAEIVMAPILAEHGMDMALNPMLFARTTELFNTRTRLGLDLIQVRLIERQYLEAVRRGAALRAHERVRATEIASQLATLHTQFSQNVLADEGGWHLVLSASADAAADDRAGLPAWLLDAAASAAADIGLPVGTQIINLGRSLVEPFLTYSTRRDLREVVWRAFVARGENSEHDNRELIVKILALRHELAVLHGAANFSEYQLADTMAKGPVEVDRLLQQVWVPARAAALAEYEELTARAKKTDPTFDVVEAWDWRFYSEQVRQEKFDLDVDELAPYLSLDAMLGAAMDCATRLFDITFHERTDIVLYHPDVRTFEVHRADALVGVFLSDNFARVTKQSGAWMSEYRSRADYLVGPASVAVVANHNNFAKAADGQPTLLSIDDAITLFHEFGHGLHGLLSTTPYHLLAGTNVLADFIELPSQLFEHWLMQSQVLRKHARHFKTGEPIPDLLIEKLISGAKYNQGFLTVEYVAAAIADQQLHRAAAFGPVDVDAFERETLANIGMPPAIPMRHRLPHFSHLFSMSEYASAYYVYLWAEVLDADAFNAFVEAGDIFAPDVARRLLDNIYAAGNTIEPGETYRAFRGRDPGIEPLLRKRGLVA
jgi:peptidyl-dipeptidase Dcp